MDEVRIAGFRFAGEIVGVKRGSKRDRPDVGVILADQPAVAAGVFTQNKLRAAPVDLSVRRLRRGLCQGLVVNAGNANACTGAQGEADAKEMAALLALGLEPAIDPKLVCVASTGVIGEPLPMELLREGIPRVGRAVSADGFSRFARAILTTDKGPKVAVREVQLDGRTVRLAGCAKGAGMIAPKMATATTLAFVTTDATVEAAWLSDAVRAAADRTFNAVTVDGDTSTNDSLFVLASGAAGGKPLKKDGKRGRVFAEALREVCGELATMLVRDGEGATKVVEVIVEGARTVREAERAARRIAESPLVKTAIHGADPNWGRILCAVGNAGIELRADKLELDIGDVPVVRGGVGVREAETEVAAHAVMKQATYQLRVRLHVGRACASMMTCDFTKEYITINADYRS
ncbi:MAG: bifunctional glutamate N-acetyltransferase/amino-acid acetyltransferase ArgJ [Deltaproteobacteria bacterium]|nr:bifunctional glutamate N-acetyltransferase/amino-acid acetyltransferase ArgJ [Deltaproteobacteria bacterium]